MLEQLRKIVRGADDDEARPRTDNPARLLFRPLEPFLIEGNVPVRPGQIRRASLLPVWQWLAREGAPELAREFEAALSAGAENGTSPRDRGRRPQLAARGGGGVASRHCRGRRRPARAVPRSVRPDVIEDLPSIGCGAAGARSDRNARQPASRLHCGPSATHRSPSVTAALNVPSLQTPQLLPFALSLVMQRLAAPWQIIRLAIKMAASDDEIRVAATPYGIAVTIALHDLSCLAATLRADIKRGHFDEVAEHLKTLHDGVRGLRTELDLRNDSVLGQAARVDPRRHIQRAAIGNRQRARPRPAAAAPAHRQGHCGRLPRSTPAMSRRPPP